MKILIAEDDKNTRAVYERILTKLGYDVVTVPDGEQAWEILQQETLPEVVVLDWEMPRMEGIEVCERIRQAGFERYIYIIIATAKSGTQDVITGLQAGADDFLIKPIYPMVLRARLLIAERILDLERQYLIKIEEIQSLLARRNILVDVTSRRMIKDAEAKVAELDSDLERAVDEQHIEIAQILETIDSSYSRLSIKVALERARKTKRIVWSPLVVPAETTWFDFILWIADGAESLITKSLLNQTFTKQNVLIADACVESLGLVSQAVVTTLEKDNKEVVVPVLPMTTMAQQLLSIEQEVLSESIVSCFSFFEGKAVMMVVESKAEKQRTPQTLEVGDVLRSDVFTSDVRKRLLFREYTTINERHITVLHKSMGRQDIQIPVVPPSKTAQRFISFRDDA
jgi:DNA-binding response OmpR family regulator